jgi:vacuolar protein sorting-associated protein 13A/C
MFVITLSFSHVFLSLLSWWKNFVNIHYFFHARNDPPTRGVLALNTNFVRVKRPLSYKLVWQSGAPRTNGFHQNNEDSKKNPSNVDELCSVWLPVAPVGYVAMGCVVTSGTDEPPLSSVFCLTASLVSSCNIRDCIALRSNNDYLKSLTRTSFCI